MNHYKKIRLSKSETRDQHRLLMERSIGRQLGRHEVVHHIDGDKSNNRPDNLQVMTLSEHSRMHMSGRTLPQSTRIKIAKARTGVGFPKMSKDQVHEIHSSDLTCRALGRKFGVHHTTISRIRRFDTAPNWNPPSPAPL